MGEHERGWSEMDLQAIDNLRALLSCSFGVFGMGFFLFRMVRRQQSRANARTEVDGLASKGIFAKVCKKCGGARRGRWWNVQCEACKGKGYIVSGPIVTGESTPKLDVLRDCPKCHTRVLPKVDGTCPSCGNTISST